MKLSTECLEASQVDSLLQGNLTPEEYESAQDHLELCETCRARVEATIGPEQWWSDVQSVLLNSRTGSSSQRNASSTDAEPNEPSTAKLIDLLGPTDDPNMLGRIGSYEIIGLLGQGGMGAVFKGFDRSLNRFVAIKMLLPHLAASGAARKRFAREGQAVAAVVDDHVMAIHCVDEWQGVPYLVMTYSRGVSLQKRLSDNGPLEVREILRIGMQAAKGLAAAHAQGIVHRDIKPANIFLDQSVERVQLMDFGLARAVDDASLTRSGTLAGTPQYMSPEQARAETVDHRSDLFSLGSVMYAMCTGHAPFRAESSYSVLRLITDKEPRPIREVNPDVPNWLCMIIGKLMAKEANVRFESAKEVAELLEDCLAYVQQPTIAALPDGIVDRSVPGSFSYRSRTIGVFAMFAVVCSIIVAMLLMQTPDKLSPNGDPRSPTPSGNSEGMTINPDIPAEGKPIDKDKLLNALRERDRKFSRRTVELERTWNTLTSPRGEASEERFQSIKFGQADPGMPEELPEDFQQPHRIRYIWTGQNFDSTLEILADFETAIHPEHGTLTPRSIESDCFNYYRYWNRDLKIFSHSSDIAKLSGGKKAWEYLLPSGFGITHSILSISNAVEVEDGYIVKGLISLPSATIGNRKNCFEIHVDKEMILRKAVIQYHVYDFVIVTSGRSEFDGMPPLAKHAAVSIHHIGQDEKRLGDVGNYKYELIALSEKLSKEEYDLRVNFAIPKGTKLSAGLNLVDVNVDGLPGVKQIERDAPAPRPEMTPRKPDQPMNILNPKRLQIREATVVEVNADPSQQSVESKVVEFSGMRLRLDPYQSAILTEDDIMTVESVTDPNNPKASQIVLTLTPGAGERFLIETTRLSSQPNPGYLVIEFDGTVLSAPRVNSKISSKVAISFAERDKLNMESVVSAIREAIATREKVAKKEPDARSVVEAYVAAALAGDVAKAAALANNAPADPKRIRELPEFLNVQRLKIQTVYVNDPAKPTRALATSVAVKLDDPDGRRDGFMVLSLELTDDKWLVIDIDFETESGAEKELGRFLKENPNAIGLPPVPQSE